MPKWEKLKNDIADLEKRQMELTPAERRSLNWMYAEYAQLQSQDSVSMGYLAQAAQYFQIIGANDTALQLSRAFMELYDSNRYTRDIYLSMARVYLDQHASDSSIANYERAQQIASLDRSDLKDLGAAFTQISADPKSPRAEEAMIKSANIHVELGETTEAAHLYSRFVKLYPQSTYSPYAYTRWADVLEREGKLDEAKKVLETLIEAFPDDNFANDARITLEKDLLGKTDEEKFAIITGERPTP